ncbi:MAG: glycosyl hydrolase family 28-related protein [bacterium]|nr:glycosyl hydrolase family 28-related protein [bacterium]
MHVPAPTTSFVANVKDPVYGAKGDGVADDTAAIQKAIDAVHAQGGGVVDIPAGTYMINATTYQGEHGLLMKNNVILRMTETTTLKALPNASQRYSIVSFIDVENAHIRGGTIEGERDQHLDTKGQW